MLGRLTEAEAGGEVGSYHNRAGAGVGWVWVRLLEWQRGSFLHWFKCFSRTHLFYALNIPVGSYFYDHSHFTGEETRAQKGKVT